MGMHKDDVQQTGGASDQSTVELPVILAVDDDADYLCLVASSLKDEYEVLEASDGELALAQALEHVPDLVITDLMMPIMDGIELCRRLKTNIETSHIPVIMLTAKDTVESQVEGLETGADHYLVKSFDMVLLKARIKNLLGSRRQLRQYYQRSFMMFGGAPAGMSLNQKFLSQVFEVVDENVTNHDFTVEYLADQLNISSRSLYRKLNALLNETPSRLIWNARLKKAAELLKASDMQMTEIAFEVGFSHSVHFSKLFRQYYGMSPSEYRGAET